MKTKLHACVLVAVMLLSGISVAQDNADVLFSEPAALSTDPADLMTLRLEIPIKTLRKETDERLES